MAEISKQALKVENNTEFPNNNAGAITPSRLRTFNIDMIDSLVDEISYNADSASWEQSIAALEAFTGSAQSLTTSSLLITASANLNTITFTKGNGSTFDVLINTGSDATDLGPLNAFTASVAGTNAFTQSANLRLASLEATTASLNTSVNSLNGFTQSIQTEVDNIQAVTASYATTGSNTFVGNQTIQGSISASSFVSASKFVGDGSQITGITASVATSILNDGVFQGTATSLNFTGSGVNASVVAGVAIIQAEVDQTVLDRYTTTASFNAYTQSIDAELNTINAFTASVAGTNAFTQSANSRLNSLEAFTASLDTTYVTQAELAAATGALEDSIDTKLNTSSFDAFSQSIDARVDSLEAFSSSLDTNFASQTEFNTFTQSADGRLDAIEAQSGSWVTAAITASSLQTASFAAGTITFTKGDGSTFGVVIPDVSGSAGDFVTTASFNAYTQSNDTKWNNLGSQTGSFITESETGSFAKTTGFTGFQTFDSNIDNVFSGSTYIAGAKSLYLGAGSTIETGDGANIFISGSIYMNRAGGASELIVNKIKSLGNTAQYPGQSKVLNIYGDVDVSGSFTAPLQTGYAWVGDGTNKAVQVATSSFAGVTSAITASSLVTASFSGNTLSFTKGDGSTFGVIIPDVSGSATLPAGVISGSAQISELGFISSSVTSSMAVSSSLYAETASLARNVIISAINDNQSTLPIGTVVRITGATGDNPRFNSASWDNDSTSANTLGILANTAASGDYADITVIGKVIGVNTDPALGYAAGDVLYLSSSGQFTNVQPQAPLHIVTLGEVLRAQQNNGSIFVNISNGWELNELHNVRIESAQQGDLLVYEASSSLWKNQPSSSFVRTIDTGSFATTGSNLFDGSNTFINGQTTFYTPVVFQNTSGVQNYSGSAITFGLSSTTGSNYTLKSNPFEPVLLITRESDNAKPIQMDWRDNKVTLAESGAVEIAPSAFGGFKVNTTASFYGREVWLIADGFTSSLAYISSSVSGSDSNLIFKNNALTTATAVSGSSNIFQSPGAASATFGRYVGGSGNIFITSGSVPQLTGSAGISPVMNGNIINGAGTIFMRTPVSSSAYTISHNTINGGNVNFGSAAAASFVSASAGLTFTNNFSNATVQLVANKTTLVNAPNIQQNNLGGVLTLNMDSSSIGFSSNNVQGSLTVNNLYSGSTAAGNFVTVANGLFVGTNFTLVASGSNTTLTVPRQFASNAFLGSAHSASANLLGDNSNLNAVALIGHSLSVTGSSVLQTALPTGADRGTVIVGRFNNDVQSHNTVFVVGAGTSGSIGITKRNALLIDSGSNAYFSGSLNMTGDSSFTGSMNFLSGSASGSVVTNIGDTFTGTAAVTKIISLSSAEYTALSPKDPNTLYIIV